jgi:alpha-tubulin suppressor-like RCC1 family protein
MSLRRPNGFISAGYDPLEVPNAPTIGTATSAGPTAVSVTFTAPSNVGGSAITGYVATAKKTSDGTTISGTGSSSPVTISGLTTGDAYTVTVAAVNSFGLGVSSAASNSVTPLEQQLWSWGSNNFGQLGLNDTDNRSSPVQIGSLGDWSTNLPVGTYYTSPVIKIDGALWSWGRNDFGQLGQGNTINRSSPVQVGALTGWLQTSGGFLHTLAVRSNNSLWSWGAFSNGRLGQNDTISRSSPTQVGALTNWASASAGSANSFAVKTDGTMWSWGWNYKGRLGINYNGPFGDNRSSPIQIGSLTNWYQVSSSGSDTAAIKTDGTLWTWGTSSVGQSGRNTSGVYAYSSGLSPVQVGSLSTWKQVSMGFSCGAVKTDGTLWVWGSNNSGQLGQNDTINRSSPVQVGASTDWLYVSAGKVGFFVALKTNGTLWAWGYNVTGGLGLSDTANRSSPVQIGALTTWLSVSAAGRNTIATKSA